MGNLMSRLSNILIGLKDARICLVGLDGAGKTTFLYRLKLGEQVQSIPTIGFNHEEVEYKNIRFSVWDIGGQERIRALWRHYYHGCCAVIFMVDSTDHDRFVEAKDELHRMMNDDELRNAAVLVLANKMDMPRAAPCDKIATALALNKLPYKRQWRICPTNASTGEGVWEALDWLAHTVKNQPKETS